MGKPRGWKVALKVSSHWTWKQLLTLWKYRVVFLVDTILILSDNFGCCRFQCANCCILCCAILCFSLCFQQAVVGNCCCWCVPNLDQVLDHPSWRSVAEGHAASESGWRFWWNDQLHCNRCGRGTLKPTGNKSLPRIPSQKAMDEVRTNLKWNSYCEMFFFWYHKTWVFTWPQILPWDIFLLERLPRTFGGQPGQKQRPQLQGLMLAILLAPHKDAPPRRSPRRKGVWRFIGYFLGRFF